MSYNPTPTDDDAIHDNVDGEIAAVAAKATPTTSDLLLIEDAAASNAKKRITIGDLPAAAPAAHALGGAEHTADTLANLNAKVSDATLDDSSASRPPTGAAGGDLGGTYPSPTVNDGADSTAIHDDTASEISAITAKTPLVAADLFVIEDSAAANAKKSARMDALRITESQITDLAHTSVPDAELNWMAAALYAVETNFATLEQVNGTSAKLLVRAFDDTTEEYLNGYFHVPATVDTSGTATFIAFVTAKTAAASKNIGLTFGHRALADSESWDQAYTDEDSGAVAIDATQKDVTRVSWTETLSNLGWTAGEHIQFRVSRDTSVASNLVGDMYMLSLSIRIPRTS